MWVRISNECSRKFLYVFSVDFISPSLTCVFCIILTLTFESPTSWYASPHFLYETEENLYLLSDTQRVIICIFLLFPSEKGGEIPVLEKSYKKTFLKNYCLWNMASSSVHLVCVLFRYNCSLKTCHISPISSFSHLL